MLVSLLSVRVVGHVVMFMELGARSGGLLPLQSVPLRRQELPQMLRVLRQRLDLTAHSVAGGHQHLAHQLLVRPEDGGAGRWRVARCQLPQIGVLECAAEG